MRSHRVDVVCLLLGSVKKRGRESITQPFILPGKVIQAEWHKPSSLVENIKSKPQTAKTIPALNNDFKFFLSASAVSVNTSFWQPPSIPFMSPLNNSITHNLFCPLWIQGNRFRLHFISCYYSIFLFSLHGHRIVDLSLHIFQTYFSFPVMVWTLILIIF